MKLADYAINKPATVIISLVGIFLFGFLSISGMKKDLITSITLPQIMVYDIYPGAGPFDIEQSIVKPFEKAMAAVSGVNKLESDCMKSVGFVTATCDWNADLNQMKIEIESAIREVSLPENAFPPRVLIFNSNLLPILSFKVEPGFIDEVDFESGQKVIDPKTKKVKQIRRELTPLQITQFLEENLITQLQQIVGVSLVTVLGGANQEVSIRLDMDKMLAVGVSPLQIYTILNYSNKNLPAGNVYYEGRFLSFRTEGKFNSIEDIRDMVIDFKEEEKTYIRLSDVAEVELITSKNDHYVEFNREPIIVLEIEKLPSGDTVQIIKKAKALISQTNARFGNILSFEPILDTSKDIRAAIEGVIQSAFIGIFAVVFVIFLFLQNIRITIILGASIPFSVIMAFIGMKLAGLNMNLMTMGGLTVALGMIVDSSIVVLENTWNLFLKTGDAKKAASEGADEVGKAVVASILTSLVVFIPILTLSGLVGAILRDVSLTIVFALTASLIVAVFVVPFLCSVLLKRPRPIKKTRFNRFIFQLGKKVNGVLSKIDRFYSFLISASIKNRIFVLVLALLILILSIFCIGLVGFEFLDAPDMGEFEILVKTPSGHSMEETLEKMRLLNDELNDILGSNLKSGQFTTGQDPVYPIYGNPTTGTIRLRLIDSRKRSKGMSIFKVIPMLQEELPKRVPGVDITVNNGGLAAMLSFATGGAGFVVEVFGEDLEDLSKVALEVARRIQDHPSVYKTQMNVNLAEKELVSKLDLSALGSIGLSSFEAAVSELIVFQGLKAGSINLGKEDVQIRLSSNLENSNIGADTLNSVPVKTQKGDFFTMAVVSDLVQKSSSDRIPRVNKMRSITVTGLISDGADIAREMRPILNEIPLPSGTGWEIAGSSSLLAGAIQDLLVVLGIAIFLVYAVMVIQFQRFAQPLIILSSIPFIFIGVALALLLSVTNLSLVAMLAVISLVGCVINNAIVLVDYTNLLRSKYHQTLDEAVINAGRLRLKPILMTSLTTALGVVPMIVSKAEGAELLRPLGLVIAGGLLTSTFITLIIVPILYHLLEFRKEERQLKSLKQFTKLSTSKSKKSKLEKEE